MSLAAYVSEDGLVGHHWEERPLGLAKFIWPCTGELQGQEVGVGGWGSGWVREWGSGWVGEWGVCGGFGITLEM